MGVQEGEDKGMWGSKKVRMEVCWGPRRRGQRCAGEQEGEDRGRAMVLEHNLKRTNFRRVVEEI